MQLTATNSGKRIYDNAKIAFLLRKSNLLVYFVAKNQA